MQNTKWCQFIVPLLWAELFIALPCWLGSVVFCALIASPHYQAFCLQFGFWGIALGMTLPRLPLNILGMLIGYCLGVFAGCRLYGKEQFSTRILGKREIWLFSNFTRRLLSLVPN